MNTLLSAQSIAYRFTGDTLFENISLTLNNNDRIGLIGHNGCGKSTLLQLLDQTLQPDTGTVSMSASCIVSRVEQNLPEALAQSQAIHAVIAALPGDAQQQRWQAELMLSELQIPETMWSLPVSALSGGQQTRVLLARALMNNPNLLLLDEPSNHLDLPAALWLEEWLESFRHSGSGGYVLVSHDQRLLDRTTTQTWIMRDKTLHHFELPCSTARQALQAQDQHDAHAHDSEQREINRINRSARRLATWGKVYDNENLARKAKTMEKRAALLQQQQTELSEGSPWQLQLRGSALPADRLMRISNARVRPAAAAPSLFKVAAQQVKSGDRVAVIGANGRGKSSMLRMLWQHYQLAAAPGEDTEVTFHPQCRVGYYDQSLQQLADTDSLFDALLPYCNPPAGGQIDEHIKRALINAGFAYARHQQAVGELSGGERSRLLFVALSLASYHLLLLDEPTNHLDLDGKEQLAEALTTFSGAVLLVTHDRELIELACNQFWLIVDDELQRWLAPPDIYQQLSSPGSSNQKPVRQTAAPAELAQVSQQTSEDELLERLLHLEEKLSADLKRKTSHQKPRLQIAWRDEITDIRRQLKLDE